MDPNDEIVQTWDRTDKQTQCFFHEWFDIPFPFQMDEKCVIENVDRILTQPQVFPDGKLLRVKLTKRASPAQKTRQNTIPDLSQPDLYATPCACLQAYYDSRKPKTPCRD